MSAKSNADYPKTTSGKSSARKATGSTVLGSAKSTASAHGGKGSVADDLESLHVPVVGEEEDHDEEEGEEEDTLQVSDTDIKATTPGYSAFARKQNKNMRNGPNDWLNLPKIRKNKKKKKGKYTKT